MNAAKLRVAAYARVSTDKEDQINSFENQTDYFSQYIRQQPGWTFVNVYCDEGLTGTNTKLRRGFQTMVQDAMDGKLDLIITKEVSRFARNIEDAVKYTRVLKEHNVYVRFLLDGIDTAHPDAELKLAIFSALAQEESRKISERVKWGQTRQMEKGVVFGGDLLGYRVNHGTLCLVEHEAEVVRTIFHKYLNEEKGAHTIAAELNASGVVSKRQGLWSATAVLRILRNEKYVGDLCQKKTFTKNYLDHKKRCNRGEEAQIYIKDHHADIAIISRETWNATQTELKRRAAVAARRSKHSTKHWASGMIECGICHAAFIKKLRQTAAGPTGTWRCEHHVTARSTRKAVCTLSEGIRDCCLTHIAAQLIAGLIGDGDAIFAQLLCELNDCLVTDAARHAERIQKRRTSLEHRHRQLLDMRLNGELSAEEFVIKRADIAGRLGQLASPDPITPITSQQLNQWLAEPDCAQAVFRQTIENIVVYPGHTLLFRFRHIAVGVCATYRISGRLSGYRTEITAVHLVTSLDGIGMSSV